MGGGHLEHELGVTLPLDGEHALAAVEVGLTLAQQRAHEVVELAHTTNFMIIENKTHPGMNHDRQHNT